ncbi:hypothetical protein [Pseudomonas sp. MWU16-30317]|uniref:hypothetical protein n=1 Tax=Pseudomonas sp. MWU16-30317 TaxID=2878095 RepID=UPI001CFC25EE|nr:hypothetical protein [Pseudomonas sp. MWU16-30317]
MSFNTRLKAAKQKRADERERRQKAYQHLRAQALSKRKPRADDEVAAPYFETSNMVEDRWFKAGQKNQAQPVYLLGYFNPSEYPGEVDKIFLERKHQGEPDLTYQLLGEVIELEAVAGLFPVRISMPAVYMNDEGAFDYRFRVESWAGPESTSKVVSAIQDWTPPGATDEMLAPVIYPFDQETFLVDDAYIAGLTQGLEVEIPTYANDDAGDVIMWSWLGQIPEDGQPLPNMQEALLVDRKVTVPKQLLLDTAEVNGRCYFFYFLKDKPGNISRLSQALPVKVAKGPVPGPIARPSVFLANPKLEYADIAQGIDVTVGPIGDYFRSSDSIVVTWGATDLPPVYLYNGVGFPMDIRVPNDVLRKEYPEGTTGDVDIKVSYQVWRGYNAWPSAEITVIANFETVGPPNPEWPEPVNPDLPRVTLKPFAGDDNTLEGKDNFEKDATLKFALFDGAKEGDVIQAYWRDVPVGDPHSVAAGDLPGSPVDIKILWGVIQAGGNGLEVPVSYSISDPSGANELWCKPTPVLVNVVELTLIAPGLPQAEADNERAIINCRVAHMDHGRIHIKIPRNPQFEDGKTEVTVYWKGYTRASDGGVGVEIPQSHQTKTFKWSSTNDISTVEPAEDRLFSLHPATGGSGWCQYYYTIAVEGLTVTSQIKENLVTMGTPGGLCEIPQLP